MNRDRSFRLFQGRRETALHHERGEEGWGAGDAVLAVDQYPFALVRLFLQPKQSFLHMLGIDDSCVGGRNPLVHLAGMFRSFVSPRWVFRVGAANVENCRDLLWIVADEFVCVLLTAEPQVVNDVVHHDGLSSPCAEIASSQFSPKCKRRITTIAGGRGGRGIRGKVEEQSRPWMVMPGERVLDAPLVDHGLFWENWEWVRLTTRARER